MAASTPALGDENAAQIPSPVCLNMKPPCASIASRNTSSCAASAPRMPSASASHRRVEPSTSVNKNVTTPDGAADGGADNPAESHNRRGDSTHIVDPALQATSVPTQPQLGQKPVLGFERSGRAVDADL